jgi:hypothetical protein
MGSSPSKVHRKLKGPKVVGWRGLNYYGIPYIYIPEHSFTSWLIILDRSSFKDKQIKWGDPLILFVFCGSMQMNIETTFSFECQFTRKI